MMGWNRIPNKEDRIGWEDDFRTKSQGPRNGRFSVVQPCFFKAYGLTVSQLNDVLQGMG